MPQPSPSAEDRFLIADLCARYAWALDTGDTDGLVACFASDGVFDEMGVATGHDDIRRSVVQNFHENPLFAGRQHLIGQVLFSEDPEGRPDHWKMKAFAHVVVLRDVGASLFWTGYYDDVVAKIGGEWLFKYRKAARWSGGVLSQFPPGTIAQAELPPNFGRPVS